ncbi:MAG: hypothetical protein JWN67_4143 [Actinomycetia bacterium]|nr:hypothetical protein [Actinomycetes bacterium]
MRSDRATSGVLGAIGLLHVWWGVRPRPADGSRATDAIVGSGEAPSRAACFVVAGLLGVASAGVAGLPRRPRWISRVIQAGAAVSLGARGAFGLAGRTDLLVPGSTSPTFRKWDRRVYAPLCVALAAGAGTAAMGSSAVAQH